MIQLNPPSNILWFKENWLLTYDIKDYPFGAACFMCKGKC